MKHTHKWCRYGLVEIEIAGGVEDAPFFAEPNIARAWYRGWVCLGCGEQGFGVPA